MERQVIRNETSVSAPLPTPAPEPVGPTFVGGAATELRTAAKKIVLFYDPWATWVVSGTHICGGVEGNHTGPITASDKIGLEILSLVPLSVVQVFLTASGRTFVSPPKLPLQSIDDPNLL